MTDRTFIYAASEAELLRLVGLGRRDDAEAGLRWRALAEFAPAELDLALASLLWLGDPRVPLDGNPGDYWRAVAAIVTAISVGAHDEPDLQAPADLDALFAGVGVAPEALPRAVAHAPALALPEPEDLDVRVVPRPAAQALARAWLAGETASHPAFTAFCSRFAADAGTDADWILVTPGTRPRVLPAGSSAATNVPPVDPPA